MPRTGPGTAPAARAAGVTTSAASAPPPRAPGAPLVARRQVAPVWLVLLLTALWVEGGGVQELTSVSGALMSTGRLTGLIASALLLLQVLLMARIPWVEQAWGQDELARTHRLVGFTSFTLMLGAHRAHHPRVRRGDRAWACGAPSSTSPSTTPGCCWRSPARPPWSWSWSPR